MLKTEKTVLHYNTKVLFKNTIDILASHEFMAPINGILGFSEFLQKENLNLNDEDKKAVAKDIGKGAKRLKNITEKLFTWYKLLNEQSIAGAEKFELSVACVKALIKLEVSEAGRPEHLLQFSADSDLYLVQGERNRVMIALRELIQNAFKFSNNTTTVHFSIKQTPRKVKISITNQSLTASCYELQRHKVFDQLHSRKSKKYGIGLGLEIARISINQCMGVLKINQGVEERQVVVSILLNKPAIRSIKKLQQ